MARPGFLTSAAALMLLAASASAQTRWTAPPEPPVRPTVSGDKYNDRDGDGIADSLFARMRELQYRLSDPDKAVSDAAEAELAQPVRIQMVFGRQVTQRDIDDFEAMGGVIEYVYRRTSYGWHGSLPLDQVEAARGVYGGKLLLVQDAVDVKAHLHIATKTTGVRRAWSSNYKGDPNITIAIVDTGISSSGAPVGTGLHADFVGRQQLWLDTTSDAAASPRDLDEHGSHVAGIALGTGASAGTNPTSIIYTDASDFPAGAPGLGDFLPNPWEVPTPSGGAGPAIFDWASDCTWTPIALRTAEMGGVLYQYFNDPATTANDIGYYSMLLPVTDTTGLFNNAGAGFSAPLVQHLGPVLPGGANLNSAIYSNMMLKNAGLGWGLVTPNTRYSTRTTLTAQNGHSFRVGDTEPLFQGVAPECRWAGYKVFTDAGAGNSFDLQAAVDDIALNASANGIKVANMSLGLSIPLLSIRNSVNTASSSGVLFVASQGNDGPVGLNTDPSRAGKALTVAAATTHGKLTEYTTLGFDLGSLLDGEDSTKPDIMAPGGSDYFGLMMSVDSNDADASTVGFADKTANDYRAIKGTSMSAPFATGCAALVIDAWQQAGHVWSHASDSDPLFVKMLLCATASESNLAREADPNGGTPTNSPSLGRAATPKDSREGYGNLNVEAAIECLTRAPFTTGPISEALDGWDGTTPFNASREGKRASGFNVALTSGITAVYNLDVPPGADFDLYLYDSVPGTFGNPTILASSTSPAPGADETITYVPAATRTAYLVAKRVSGSGTFTLAGATFPTVASITRANANPTNQASVDFTVTFSEAVTGVDNGDFSLSTAGVAGATVTGVAGGGATWTVSVSTGAGDGTIRLDLDDNDSIQNASLQPLGGAGIGNGSFNAGETYTVDKTAPFIVSVNRTGTSPTNASLVEWAAAFNEDIAGATMANFAMSGTGTLAGFSISSATVFSNSVTVQGDSGTGDGDLGLDLANTAGVTDLAGNAATGAPFSGQIYTIDRTAPAPLSLTRDLANPTAAATVTWTLALSEPVSGLSTSNFSLATAGVAGAALTNVTGGPSVYTIEASTGLGDGTIRADLSAALGRGDAAGNVLTGTPFAGETYTVDKSVPTVVSITRDNANPTNAGSIAWTVTFSEPVSGGLLGDFSLNTTGTIAGAALDTIAGSGATRTVTATTGTGDGDIRLDLPGAGTFADAASNPPSNVPFNGEAYTLDRTVPTLVGITRNSATPTGAASVSWTAQFSEDMLGVLPGNFALQAFGVSGASLTGVAGPGAAWTITANTGTGNGTIGVDLTSDAGITDLAGNALVSAPTVGEVYAIDKIVPVVVSIVRNDTNPTNAVSVSWTVTFSEPVVGGAPSNFALNAIGPGSTSITSVAGGGNTRTVTADTGTGDGTLALMMVNSVGVADGSGNAVLGLPFLGQAYQVDKTGPSVISIVRNDANPTNQGTVTWAVSFSEPVVGGAPGNFGLTPTGTIAGESVTGVAGINAVRIVSAATGTGDGTLALSLVDSTGLADVVGNPIGSLPFAGAAYDVDKTAPAGSIDAVADPTRAGTLLVLNFTTTDASATSTRLFVRRPGDALFSDTGLAAAGASGSFNFNATVGQNGLYEFAAAGTDSAGNAEPDPVAADTTVLLNTVPNGPFVQTAITGTDTLLFPMTDALDMTVTLASGNVGGTITLSRTVGGVAAAPPAGILPNHLIDEALNITSNSLVPFNATLTWNYDPASDDALVGPLDNVFQYDGGTLILTHGVTPVGTTLTIPAIADFESVWYAGNNSTRLDEWQTME